MFLALKLSARGLNIVAPRPAHVNLHTGIVQDLLKARDLRVRRSEIGSTGMRIERNDVDFAANPLEKLGKLALEYVLGALPGPGRSGAAPNPDLIPANNTVLQPPVAGKVGLWSKSDSVSYFKDYVVTSRK